MLNTSEEDLLTVLNLTSNYKKESKLEIFFLMVFALIFIVVPVSITATIRHESQQGTAAGSHSFWPEALAFSGGLVAYALLASYYYHCRKKNTEDSQDLETGCIRRLSNWYSMWRENSRESRLSAREGYSALSEEAGVELLNRN